MKRKLLLVMGIVVFSLGGVQATIYSIVEFPVCVASGDQTRPDISGDNVVWTDHRTIDYNVRFKNLSTGNESVISISRIRSNSGPAIDGDIVTWSDTRSGVDHWYDIYGYDISTSTEFLISPQGDYRVQPDISGDIVVYQENAPGSDNYDIYGYDLSTGTRFPVCTNILLQVNAATNGNIVVWQDERNGNRRNFDIYGYDIATQTEFPICRVDGEQRFPAISENLVVWRDPRDGWDIYGYDITSQTEVPICTDGSAQDLPAISENFVVWQDYRNGDWDIYGYDLLTHTEFPITTGLGDQLNPSISGNTVVWESAGDIYGAEIITDPTLLTIVISPSAEGINTVIPSEGQHEFALNETVNLNASNFVYCPDVYKLDHWEGDVVDSNSANTTIIMDTDKTVTAVFVPTRKCGDECHPNFLLGDLNHDCIIDLSDLAMLESRWLTCTKPECDGGDIVPPLPDPMTWVIPPQLVQIPPLVGPYYNDMIATTAVDPAPAGYDVEYFFECQEDAGKNSGWQSNPYYRVQVADGSDYYHFRVKARDISPNNNETTWSCICYAGDPPPVCGCLGP